MKKVLIITYYWPPSGGAGVQRWLKFVKYLRQFQWEPVVFTPSNPESPETDLTLEKDIPPGIEVVKIPIWEPYSAYKRFIGRGKEEKISSGFLSEKKKPGLLENVAVWIRGNLFIPDARKFWIRPSINYLIEYLQHHPVSVLITTGPPHSCHLIGLGLKKKINLPWIADFRDPWSRIDFYNELKLSSWADKKHKKLEKKVLQSADKVIMISRSQAALFREIHARDYEVITNGYDPEDYTLDEPVVPDQRFSIAHIGSLVPSRNPVVLWKALEELCSESADFSDSLEIKLVGKTDYSVIESLKDHHLTEKLNKIDYLPHEEVVKIQFEARVLLLLINNSPNAGSILTGKFFEYLAAHRPILCIGPLNGDAATILKETRAGHTAGYDDVKEVKSICWKYFQDFMNGQLSSKAEAVEQYSRVNLTQSLARILDSL